ncbi:putative PurR-regulated permease PerM [Methanofollis sp. W23]|uniref:AI-2E family transporter n=1 Tax=Methanofollis sp. W23 TaxID=2817849 RepID=UPI001AE1297E|nr:AI-2E family transporter [Methanofollis sp. W23]MBP2145721.1 putative PurR-regulated permease PerM [Methanofollis sp. W23]
MYISMTYHLSPPDRLTLVLVFAVFLTATVAFWDLLWVVVLALSLAVVVLPLQRRLVRWGIPEGVAALAVTVIVFLALTGAVGFTAAVLAQNADFLAEIVQGITGWIGAAGVDPVASVGPESEAAAWFNEWTASLTDAATTFAAQVPTLVLDFIVFFLALYMFIYRGAAVAAELTAALPSRLRAAVERMTRASVDTLYAIYIVHVATSVITFFLAIPFFWVLGYDHVIFFAVMAGIFQLIPIIGPSVIMLIVGAFALSQGDLRGAALAAFVGYPLVCALPDIYFRPLMMGRRARIHPVIMWIGFFGGLVVMGLVGFILGPVLVVLAITAYHILVEELEGAKETAKG